MQYSFKSDNYMKSQLDNVKINTELVREKWVVTFTIGIQKFILYPCESSTEAQFMENMLKTAFKNLLIHPEKLDDDLKFIDNVTKYDYNSYLNRPNVSKCLHELCPKCKGTGIDKMGNACFHNLSCQCPKCNFTC